MSGGAVVRGADVRPPTETVERHGRETDRRHEHSWQGDETTRRSKQTQDLLLVVTTERTLQ